MANTLGRLEHVGIGIEATRGTAVAPVYWLPVMDKDFDDRSEIVLDESGVGVLAENSGASLMKQWADGSVRMNVYEDSIGTIVTLMSGAGPTTNLASGEYTHTWEQTNTVTNKSATLAIKDANTDLAFVNTMLDSVTFTLETGSFFNTEIQFMSKKSEADSNTPSRTAENIFAPQHGVIKLAAAQSGLAAAGAISVRSANFTVAKNAEDKQNLGSVDISDVHNRSVAITGTLEIYYTDTTYKNYVFDETERALRIGVVNTDVTLANSNNPHLYFDFYRVRFSDWERQRGNNDIVMETVNFTALTDYANTQKIMKVELRNGEAGTNYGG
jgi:hypothetical protein